MGHEGSSEVMRGPQRSHRSSIVVLRSPQRLLEVIRGPSEVMRGPIAALSYVFVRKPALHRVMQPHRDEVGCGK
jgi:hypothetical protein